MRTEDGQDIDPITGKPLGKPLGASAGPSAYQKYFAGPLTAGVEKGAGALLGPLGILESQAHPQVAKSVAETVVPQTPKQAGIDAGMLAGMALAPEAVVPGIATRMGLAALGGGLGSKAGGDSAIAGAKSGALQQGLGEAAAPIINMAGAFGKTALNKEDVGRIGKYLKTLVPGIGDLSKVEKFDSAFRGGEATEKVGKRLAQYEDAISKRLGKKEIGSMTVMSKAGPNTAPIPLKVDATFDDMIGRIRTLNRVGYAYSGDATQKALAADARREAHDLVEELGSALNKQTPGLGDRFLKMRRQFATTSTFQRIFSDPDLYDPSGRMKMDTLQQLVANRGAAGFREDLVRVLGRGKANDLLNKVYRGAASTARDVPASLNLRGGIGASLPRVFFRPQLGQTVGQVPRHIPKIPPGVAGLLGQLLPNQSEQ